MPACKEGGLGDCLRCMHAQMQLLLLLLLPPPHNPPQVRYKQGVLSMLEQYESGKPFEEDNYIVKEGTLASQYS